MANVLMIAYTNYTTDARPKREAEALALRGDRVDFVSLREQSRPDVESVNGVHLFRVSMLRYRGGSGGAYVLSYIKFFLFATVKVIALYFRNRYDVIYVHTMPDFMVFVGLIPKLFGAKVVLNMHDTMPELYMSKFGLSEGHLIIRLVKFQEWISFSFADKVICVHEPHKALLMSRGAKEKKITVLMNLPDPRVFTTNNSEHRAGGQPYRLVYHGTIAERLGLDIAVQAFREVVTKYPNARFDIFGDGDFAESLASAIAELELEEHVHFSKKFFRVEELPSLVGGATLGLVPNRKDIATEYMLPVKMLEYVYMRIPVVAPRLKTIMYYFDEDSTAFYAPGDPHELAQIVIQMFADESRRKRIVESSNRFLKKYDWNVMKTDLFNVIDN